MEGWTRPRRVVKRLTRVVRSDGSESIKVEFIFADAEVDRVMRNNLRRKKDREAKRSTAVVSYGTQLLTGRAAAASSSSGGGSSGARRAGESDEEEDMDELIAAPTSIHDMTLKVSHLKRSVDENKQQKWREAAEEEYDPFEGTGGGRRGSSSRGGGRHGAGHMDDLTAGGFAGGGGSSKSKTKSSKRSLTINNRVPRISLAVRLEEELMEVWKHGVAGLFQHPVTNVFGYENKLQAHGLYPICLEDIRKKITTYQYETAAEMEADMDRIVRNTECFNGKSNMITRNAVKLQTYLKTNLQHDRKILGENMDAIHHMEEAIKRKKVYLEKLSTVSGGNR